MSKLILKNQFGEESINDVLSGSGVGPEPTKTVMANDTGGSAAPTAVPFQTFSNHLPAKAGVTSIAAIPTPVTAITITLSTGDVYTDAAVKAAIDAALVTVVADLQTQLTKVNAILAALKVIT